MDISRSLDLLKTGTGIVVESILYVIASPKSVVDMNAAKIVLGYIDVFWRDLEAGYIDKVCNFQPKYK